MPTASKVLVRKGESALDRLATAAAISSATEEEVEEGTHDMSGNSNSKSKQYPNTLQGRIQELEDVREKYGPSLKGMIKGKRKNRFRGFCRDLRQSRKNPHNPKYQLSESDISQLDSFGFEWELPGTSAKKKKSSPGVKSHSIVFSEVRAPTRTRSGRTVKRKSPVDLGLTSSKKVKEEKGEQSKLPGDFAGDHTLGEVTLLGETTLLRYEIQQLKIFYEKYGKYPSPNSREFERRLNELCNRLRQVRRDPTTQRNRKLGDLLSDEILSELESFNFEWEPVVNKPKQYPNIHYKVVSRN